MRDADWLRSLKRVQRVAPTRELADLIRQRERVMRARLPSEPPQLVFAVVEVYCQPLEGRISLAQCVARQEARTPSGGGRGFPIHQPCQGCALKEVHRSLVPALKVKPYRAFSISRENAERAARQRKWRNGELGRVPNMDDGPSESEE